MNSSHFREVTASEVTLAFGLAGFTSAAHHFPRYSLSLTIRAVTWIQLHWLSIAFWAFTGFACQWTRDDGLMIFVYLWSRRSRVEMNCL